MAATRPRPLAIGYCRVSTAEQAESGAGLSAQEHALRTEAAHKGWDLLLKVDAGVSGGIDASERPALSEVLTMLSDGSADVLLLAKLDRLSRSAADGAALLELAQREGWALVSLDLGIDTSTPTGEAMANVMLSFARLEKRMISQRTKDGLAAKRAQGVRLGRPSQLPEAVVLRVLSERAAGVTLQAIADGLADDGISTAQGGTWHAATVAKLLRSQDAQRLAAE